MKTLGLIALLWVTEYGYANEAFPKGCTPIPIENETILLSPSKPAVMLLHNLSEQDLWLVHQEADPGAGAGWASRLQPNHWSALMLDKQSLAFQCIESRPGHEQQIVCGEVTAVCAWSTVHIPEKAIGSFWAGENMPLSTLIAYLGRKGFVAPVQTQAKK